MEKNIFLGFIDEFFDFVEELKQYNGFKTTIKENIYRVCKRDRNEDYGKIIISKGCYDKIANKEYNCMILDYVTNKHDLTYSLQDDNTILLFKRA